MNGSLTVLPPLRGRPAEPGLRLSLPLQKRGSEQLRLTSRSNAARREGFVGRQPSDISHRNLLPAGVKGTLHSGLSPGSDHLRTGHQRSSDTPAAAPGQGWTTVPTGLRDSQHSEDPIVPHSTELSILENLLYPAGHVHPLLPPSEVPVPAEEEKPQENQSRQ